MPVEVALVAALRLQPGVGFTLALERGGPVWMPRVIVAVIFRPALKVNMGTPAICMKRAQEQTQGQGQ